jgi:L-asparaginase
MSKQKGSIDIFMTGGTIDSFYDGTKDTVFPLKKSCIPNFIKSLKLSDSISFKQICMKDSRSLTPVDIKKILQSVNQSKSKRIIITHGTYTMPNTARFLAANLKRKDQIIILTGSMIPITGFSPSDAPFNLGYSLASVKTLTPGVYVCMNGQIFTPQVVKIVSEGRFSSTLNK